MAVRKQGNWCKPEHCKQKRNSKSKQERKTDRKNTGVDIVDVTQHLTGLRWGEKNGRGFPPPPRPKWAEKGIKESLRKKKGREEMQLGYNRIFQKCPHKMSFASGG